MVSPTIEGSTGTGSPHIVSLASINEYRPSSATPAIFPHNAQLKLVSPTTDAEGTTTPPLTTPNKRAKMSHLEPNSSPLSSAPTTSPEQATLIVPSMPTQDQDAAVPSIENGPSSMENNDSLPQAQQVLAPAAVSTIAPISNMGAKRAPKQSPKRAREEDDNDEDEAFGTSPPKRPARNTNEAASGKTATRKAVTPKKPASEKAMPKKTPAKKTAVAPPPPSSRPSRTRKAPERFGDLEERPVLKALPDKKGLSKVFDPIYITTNSSSRLVKADIYHMLLEGPAWTSLSPEQQSTIISMLPHDTANQALLASIDAGELEDTRPSIFTLINNCFRTDVAKFQEDLRNGHLAKTWQAAAEQAVIERAAGEYDEWKAKEAEAWWGQKAK